MRKAGRGPLGKVLFKDQELSVLKTIPVIYKINDVFGENLACARLYLSIS